MDRLTQLRIFHERMRAITRMRNEGLSWESVFKELNNNKNLSYN